MRGVTGSGSTDRMESVKRMESGSVKIRAEAQAIMLFNREKGATAYLDGVELSVLEQWASGCLERETGFIQRLRQLAVLEDSPSWKRRLLDVIAEAGQKQALRRSFCAPESLHVELTTRCPLRCPQCYKGRPTPRDLPFAKLLEVICQAGQAGVFQFALGGGEPLLYPRLKEAVEAITKRNMSCSLTTSGAGLSEAVLDGLLAAGLNHVQVSLNGSTPEINGFSRDGYEEAAAALELLGARAVSRGINWVARRDNLSDLAQLARLAVSRGAENINVLAYKPSDNERYEDVSLSQDETRELAETLKEIHRAGQLKVKVDSAYSNLLCGINGRAGAFSGCGAGRRFLALDAEGLFRPCSHVEPAEAAGSLMEYWSESGQLEKFRTIEESIGEPCASCRHLAGCRGCRAIDGFYEGNRKCPFYRVNEGELQNEMVAGGDDGAASV